MKEYKTDKRRIYDENLPKLIQARVTAKQHAKYLALGGSQWLRDTLDETQDYGLADI